MKRIILNLAPALFLLASCKSADIREPEYRDVRDVRIVNVGILQTTASLNMVYYNPNKFSVQVSDASGRVYIDNVLLGNFSLAEKVKVRKRRDFVVPAIIKLNNLSVLANHRELWNKKEAHVRIEGLARVKKAGIITEVPIHYEGLQNIEKMKALIPIK